MEAVSLEYKEKELRFLGRNGSWKQGGIEVQQTNDEFLRIVPLTSKGFVGTCEIQVPMTQVDNLIEALKSMKK